MKRFYITTNEIKDSNFEQTKKVKSLIERLGGEVTIASIKNGEYLIEGKYDGIITLGGDGTLIRAVSKLYSYEIPVIGVNLGKLGYLTEIELENLEDKINQLVHGNYMIEERMMLECNALNMCKLALNDVVITSANKPGVIEFDVIVNGEFLHEYKADGILISTPTGSTGYNMSAGGPIVEPRAKLMVLTPICAHSLHGRSIVLSNTDIIEIILKEKYLGSDENGIVSVDGDSLIQIKNKDKVKIKMAQNTLKLIRLNPGSFLETLSKKMEV